MTFFETRKFIEKQNSTLEFQFESLLSDFSRIKGNIKSLTVWIGGLLVDTSTVIVLPPELFLTFVATSS